MASWETKNRLAEFLVKNEATALERAIPFGEAVKAGAVGRSNIYQIADKDLGFHSLYGADGKRAIWYDHDSLSEMCRFGEYYPKSIPIKPTAPVGSVSVECSHPTIKLPGNQIITGGTKGKPILVEWIRPGFHKSSLHNGEPNVIKFFENIRLDSEALMRAVKKGDGEETAKITESLIVRLVGAFGHNLGDELE